MTKLLRGWGHRGIHLTLHFCSKSLVSLLSGDLWGVTEINGLPLPQPPLAPIGAPPMLQSVPQALPGPWPPAPLSLGQ